jgi:hypothetical protein
MLGSLARSRAGMLHRFRAVRRNFRPSPAGSLLRNLGFRADFAVGFDGEEPLMQGPEIDRPVRLVRDIPELHLRCGDVGVVCSTWFAPAPVYEVEFKALGESSPATPTRALLRADQIEVPSH